MGASEKMDAGMDKLKGKAKEAAGHVTDNEKLVAEGHADQAKGDLKSAAEKAKDTVKDVFKD
jgi:uncharacterized protein YjbJ (UPF0337 family)